MCDSFCGLRGGGGGGGDYFCGLRGVCDSFCGLRVVCVTTSVDWGGGG